MVKIRKVINLQNHPVIVILRTQVKRNLVLITICMIRVKETIYINFILYYRHPHSMTNRERLGVVVKIRRTALEILTTTKKPFFKLSVEVLLEVLI